MKIFFSNNGQLSNHNDIEETTVQPLTLTPIDKVTVTTLETLDTAFGVCDSSQVSVDHSYTALEVATRPLGAPDPPQIQRATRAVLSALHSSKTRCYAHTDSALLKHATQILKTPSELDVEQIHHLIRIAHATAVARPGDLEKFAETKGKVGDETSSKQTRCRSDECQRFIELLSSALWRVLEKLQQMRLPAA